MVNANAATIEVLAVTVKSALITATPGVVGMMMETVASLSSMHYNNGFVFPQYLLYSANKMVQIQQGIGVRLKRHLE